MTNGSAATREANESANRALPDGRPIGANHDASAARQPAVELRISELEFAHYLEGWVDVRFLVGPDGVPVDIEITGSSLPPRFAAPSMTAVQAWRFVPHRVDGQAVPVISSARINYSD